MSDEREDAITQLQSEIARLEASIASLAALPDAQQPLRALLVIKGRQLAALQSGSPVTIGGDFVAGDKVLGDKVMGDKTVAYGPQIFGGIKSGRDTNVGANLTVHNTLFPSPPPAPQPAPDPGPTLRLVLRSPEGQPLDTLLVGEEAVLALELERSDATLPELTLKLEADGDGVEWPEGATRQLRLGLGTPTRLPRWSLLPERQGSITLRVLALVGNQLLQQLSIVAPVADAATAGTLSEGAATLGRPLRTTAVELSLSGTAGAPAHANAVSLVFTREGGTYRLLLLDGSATAVPLALTPEQLADLLAYARSELLGVATASPTGSRLYERGVTIPQPIAEGSLARLAKLGAYLWQGIFAGGGGDSRALGERLRRHSQQAQLHITVAGDQLAFPWHLLYDRDPAQEVVADGFWGLRHVVTVLSSSGRGGDLTLPAAPSILPCYNLSLDGRLVGAIDQQRAVLGALDATLLPEVVAEADLRAAFVRGSDADLIYLFCHASNVLPNEPARPGTPPGVGSTRIILTGDGQPRTARDAPQPLTLRELQTAAPVSDVPKLRHGPLVVLNACGGAALSPLTYDGLLPYLLGQGARAVVGTECDTPVIFGAAFGLALLAAFVRERLPLGEALRATRRAFVEQHGNALGLLYALYGSANIQVAASADAAPQV